MALVNVRECPTCGRPFGQRHRITTKTPSIARLERMANAAVVLATDGCRVEPDGVCEHGHQSWLLRLGWV